MASALADFWTAAWHEGIGVSGGPFSWLQATACENNPHLLPPGIPAPRGRPQRGLLELCRPCCPCPPLLPRDKGEGNTQLVGEAALLCLVTHAFNLSSLLLTTASQVESSGST